MMKSKHEIIKPTSIDANVTLYFLSSCGDRKEQQDCFGYHIDRTDCLAVVCDGMGGLKSGKEASEAAVNGFIGFFKENIDLPDAVELLQRSITRANTAVSEIRDTKSIFAEAGSTLVAVLVRDGKLFWCSAGDSRAYILRNDKFVQITTDHNYGTVLKAQRNAGQIDDERYNEESEKAGTLISFLGMQKLILTDYNDVPFELKKGDRIVLMSDGLYNCVPEDEYASVIRNNSIEDALKELECRAERNSKMTGKKRDNMTVAILEIKDNKSEDTK